MFHVGLALIHGTTDKLYKVDHSLFCEKQLSPYFGTGR